MFKSLMVWDGFIRSLATQPPYVCLIQSISTLDGQIWEITDSSYSFDASKIFFWSTEMDPHNGCGKNLRISGLAKFNPQVNKTLFATIWDLGHGSSATIPYFTSHSGF